MQHINDTSQIQVADLVVKWSDVRNLDSKGEHEITLSTHSVEVRWCVQ
jgi:hypothetical protein